MTNVSVFVGGMLVGLTTLNQGSTDITDDIAATFGLRRAEAERLKCRDSSAQSNPRDHQDVLDVTEAGDESGQERPK